MSPEDKFKLDGVNITATGALVAAVIAFALLAVAFEKIERLERTGNCGHGVVAVMTPDGTATAVCAP